MTLKRILFVAAIFLSMFSASLAQEDTNAIVKSAVESLRQDAQTKVKSVADQLESLRKDVTRSANDDSELSILKLQADELGKEMTSATAQLEKRYEVVSKRLEELGQPPADGKTEDASITDDRKRLQDEKAQMNTLLSDADALKTEIRRVNSDISDRRRALFSDTLFRRTQITVDLVAEAWQAAQAKTGELVSATTSAFDFMWSFKKGSLLAVILMSLLAALIIVIPSRRTFAHFLHRDPNTPNPRYFQRLTLAFWSVLAPTIALSAFTLTCQILLVSFSVLRVDIFEIFSDFAWASVGVYFMFKLARGVLAPSKPQWRLVDVSDKGARMLVFFVTVLALINGIAFVFASINQQFDAPVSLSVFQGFLTSLLVGLVLVCMSFTRPMRTNREGREPTNGKWPLAIRAALLAIGVGLIILSMIGYVGFAQFLSTQVIVTGSIAVTLYIAFSSAQAVSRRGAFAQTRLGRHFSNRYRWDEMRLDQVGLAVSLAVYGAIVFFGLPLILLQWGFRLPDIAGMFVQLFTEIHIGSISISLVGILAGVLVFFIGLVGSRWFQRWLDSNVLSRSQIDPGARNSVNTALGYAGVVIAALIGISAAGVDLSSFALIASALSLGIGFGLQTIVSNFVSGLILLAERPFRVGDWIVNGPVEGFVRRISVRATEIETFRNQTVIVPNSQLINAAVGNWTLRNKLGRSEIPVSVSYECDPRQVMDILLEVARRQPLVLTMPEPNVEFVRFGESSMDFELRFYLADLFTGLAVRNQIRLEILDRFREEGIIIPYPQQTVNVKYTEGDGDYLDPGHKKDHEADDALAVNRKLDERRRKSEAGARDVDKVPDNRHSHDRHEKDDDEEAQTGDDEDGGKDS